MLIPYGRQSISDEDIAAVTNVLRSDFLTQGPAIKRFEAQLADQSDTRHAVACSSGTAALHMAYAALGIGPGDTVIVPANTFLATANAAVYLGAKVRFCDVDPVTGLMTPQTLMKMLDEEVSLVVPVHFAGMPCPMQQIWEVVRVKAPQALIVEDAAHAIGGVHPDGSPVGSLQWSAMATFSFHPVKHIAAGEGGAVTTNDPKLKQKLEAFRCHGMTKVSHELDRPDEGPWYYEMHQPGFNYRIPEASCALASSQMNRLDQFVTRRREIAATYLDQLTDLQGVRLPPRSQLSASAWHLFCLHIDFDASTLDREGWMSELRDRDVGTQVHYYPVCGQPFYRNQGPWWPEDFEGAFQHYETALSIPMYPAMTDIQVQTVISALYEVSDIAFGQRRLAA